MKHTDYTLLKKPHRIPLASINQPVYALIFAISEENGLEHYRIFKKSIDFEKFNEYLDELYVENKHDNIALFFDNLRVHLKYEVTLKLNELDIESIQNVPYQPDYNPAESCLSKIKNHYKRQKLNRLVNNQEIDYEALINESVNKLTLEDIVKSIKYS